jgi:thiol:disulfide interchange protein DsbC
LQHEEIACDSALGSGLPLWRRDSRPAYTRRWVAAALLLLSTALFSAPLLAQEAQIRKNLPARLPGFPAIDRVIKTPIPGLYEVNVGTEVYYTDARGDHLIQGRILATKTRIDLTAQRIDKLSAVPFDALPLADALVWKQGNGSRRLAVFADPNCIHCKRLEQELDKLQDVTVYAFPYPILGPDSEQRSHAILCSGEPTTAWREWMLKGVVPDASNSAMCTTAEARSQVTAQVQRNVAWGQKHRVQGTPAIFFEDGKRVPGGMSLQGLQRQLQSSAKSTVVE